MRNSFKIRVKYIVCMKIETGRIEGKYNIIKENRMELVSMINSSTKTINNSTKTITHRAFPWKRYPSKIIRISQNSYHSAPYPNYLQNWPLHSSNSPIPTNPNLISRKSNKYHQCNLKTRSAIMRCCFSLNGVHSKTTRYQP